MEIVERKLSGRVLLFTEHQQSATPFMSVSGIECSEHLSDVLKAVSKKYKPLASKFSIIIQVI
jgi:hypothetical protein